MDELKTLAKDEGVTALPRMLVYKPGYGRLISLDVPYSKVCKRSFYLKRRYCGVCVRSRTSERRRDMVEKRTACAMTLCMGITAPLLDDSRESRFSTEALYFSWGLEITETQVDSDDAHGLHCSRRSPVEQGDHPCLCRSRRYPAISRSQVRFLKTNLNVIASNPGMAFILDPNG